MNNFKNNSTNEREAEQTERVTYRVKKGLKQWEFCLNWTHKYNALAVGITQNDRCSIP